MMIKEETLMDKIKEIFMTDFTSTIFKAVIDSPWFAFTLITVTISQIVKLVISDRLLQGQKRKSNVAEKHSR